MPTKDQLLDRWSRALNGLTDVTFNELIQFLKQRPLLETLFRMFDRDDSGLLSESEWIGSVYKVAETSGRTKVVRTLEAFINRFKHIAKDNDSLSLLDFCRLFDDYAFQREFALLLLSEHGKLTVMEFMDVLRSIANLKNDTKWLSWLAYQFHTAIVKHDGKAAESMNLETFKDSFYFKVPELADCLFNYLDTDKTGLLTLDKFIKNLEYIVDASDAQKVEFLFKIFDRDGDGTIDFDEMKLLLQCFLEQSPSLDLNETVAELTATLFKETDVDQSGDINLEELSAAFQRNQHLFKVLSLNTSSWIRPKPAVLGRPHKHSSTLRSWIRNNIGLLIFWTLYILICGCICIDTLVYYIKQQQHFFIIIARLNGTMLNFNCALMLVLMLRKHITWLRTKGAVILLPLDYHIDLHKIIGIILLCETILHTLAHIAYLIYVFKMCPLPKDIGYVCQNNPSLNSTKFYRYDSRLDYCVPFDYKGCGGNLNKFSTEALCTLRCSVYKYSHHHITELFFTAKIGFGYFTGIVELLLLALIYVMCLPFVRKGGHFQLFYWCHMLTLPWLGIMLLHGPRFWKWLLAPALLYTIEKILRYRKSRSHKHGETYIMEAILLPSQVIHLVISKPRKFIYKPGDYIYINIPAVAHCEWHPFSISSAPEHKDSIWLHVRACGHWTRRVYELFRQKLKQQHGGILDDYSDLRLRISMRSRMSRSYIEELRGIEKNNNQSDSRLATLNNKVYPGSFTMPKHTHESMSVTRRSMASLREVKLQRITETDSGQFNDDNSENIRMMSKTVVLDPNNLTNMTTDENEKIDYDQEGTIDINSIRATTSPTVEFKSSQIRNSISVTTNNGRSSFNIRIPKTPDDDSQERPSDALGYLRMYKDRNRIDFESLQFNEREDLQILIDGPYGAPSQHIFEAEHAVLIAAGIGITPFASILQSIMCRYRNRRHKCPKCHSIWNNSADHEQLAVRKVDFIWVTRDQRSLEWFISLLSQMEIEQKRLRAGEHEDPLLEVHLYVTSARRLSDLKALNVYLSLDLVEHKENNRDNWDAVDGIRRRTKHGRPDWDQVFTELLCQKKGKISVFYCGPPALVPDLNDKCKQYGFAFKKELF